MEIDEGNPGGQRWYIAQWGVNARNQHRWTMLCANHPCGEMHIKQDVTQHNFLHDAYDSGWRLISFNHNEPRPCCPSCVSRIRALKKQMDATAIDRMNPDGVDPEDVELEDLLDDEEPAEDEDLAAVAAAQYYEQEAAARGGTHGGLRNSDDADPGLGVPEDRTSPGGTD